MLFCNSIVHLVNARLSIVTTSVYKQLDSRKHLNGGRGVLVLVFVFHPERIKPPWVSWFVRACHFFLQVSIPWFIKWAFFGECIESYLKFKMYSCVPKVKNCIADHEEGKKGLKCLSAELGSV